MEIGRLKLKEILLVIGISGMLSAETWTCYRYVDGGPTGGTVKVEASSKQEAEKKSLEKYKKLGYRIDYTVCK